VVVTVEDEWVSHTNRESMVVYWPHTLEERRCWARGHVDEPAAGDWSICGKEATKDIITVFPKFFSNKKSRVWTENGEKRMMRVRYSRRTYRRIGWGQASRVHQHREGALRLDWCGDSLLDISQLGVFLIRSVYVRFCL
jgi:hypothetical protein